MAYRFVMFSMMLFFSCSFAQGIKFEHYNDNSGLSHNSVRHLVQDKHGFLWIGTFSGLNRFDGYEFKSYVSNSEGENKINDDDITALELDADSNNLWIGTRRGLTLLKLDTYQFTTFLNEEGNPNSLPDDEIRSVFVDVHNRVWVGTKDKGLYIFHLEENRFEKINLPGFKYIKEIFEDSSGNIWIGSFGTASVAKITLQSNGEIQRTSSYTLNFPNTVEVNPYLNFIYEDGKKDIFIGTREGLYKLNKDENKFENLFIEDSETRDALGPYFVSVAQSPDGKYWVGTLGGLLVCNRLEDIPNGDFKRYYSILTDQTSLVDNLVSSLYFDASGILWIGTEDGLDKYDPYENQFNFNKDISRFIDGQAPRIRGFAKTYNNNIVVATRHNGLFVNENGQFVPLYHNQNDIASIYSDDGKIFYCGLWNGRVLIYDYLKNKSAVVDIGFEAVPISAIKKVQNDKLVVGSFGEGAKMMKIHGSTILPYKTNVLDDGDINAIIADSLNNIWFATEAGVVKYSMTERITYTSSLNGKEGLPHNNVSDIIFDNTGRLWAATRSGLGYFDVEKNNFMPLGDYSELSGKWVTDFLLDANGNLWLNVNNNSVAWINPSTDSYNIYHVNSGNRLDFFSSCGFYNFGESNIYLGGKNGIIYFSPSSIIENQNAPRPIITEIKIENEVILPEKEINGEIPLKKDINETKSLTLSYKNRNFSLQFSTPSYSNERLNKFEYMLEGFDDNWITTTSNSRTVQYTNLFPGDYDFKIKSSNSDGNWSEAVSYTIRIERPFWLTYQALFLFLSILALTFYFIRREVKNRIRLKQELVTEKVNRERDIKLNNEKLRFFTNISHELRTPLTLILGPVKQLMEDGRDQSTEYQKSRYNLIHQNASRLLNLVNQVLDFRKAQTGELKLKVSKTDILQYTRNTFDSIKEFAYNKQIHFHFHTESDSLVGWLDRDKYDKILYNLLSNAIKFTEKFGHVDLFVGLKDYDKGHLIIEVSDDGIGIPKKSQEKIFTRFYQATNSKENNTGSGIGLSLVKSLVDLHKGSIKVKSTPNIGSVFTVIIPINRESYDQEEVFDLATNKERKDVVPDIPVKRPLINTEIKEKILVIEDNLELRKYIVDYLSGCYKVYEAENGEEGLQLCRQIKPILCVADVMMPVMDGFEFCKVLKNDEFISHIPVILLTALSENEDKVRGFDLGADGYLVKPFDPSLLKSRITNIIKTRLELKSKFSDDADSEIGLLVHSPVDKDFMEKVCGLIEKNISNPDLSTGFLCDELGVSSSKLYRKIKELTDLSPNEFVRTVRLKKSTKFLKTKKYNVSEVTDMVGFNDPLYFSRRFKQQFGFPPSRLLK
ncbi:hybrid sensor histidine kinase/response regulator transcription factor [Maribacter polysaccharolyticus]|uniref:hybrid sensor histidine kinase/response regulator transcription factor n=1 Tax=Maribacter polysaccharolyticus TaxID=3020831 RepID=UPI00237F63B9|nr:hybrid sensor histidine kinase/response regulator transcription factor [Maribacter polysaccharolyticus]MDE3742781.1 two-component regulator propeller domain-containing protein [Maribacter polysaccharolyticus]